MHDAANPESGLKILLVDSERAFHDVVSAAARRMPDAQLVCCTNPGEAVHKLSQFVPTLIIVDGLLGGAAGINFVKRVRAGQTPAPDGTLVVFVARDFTGGLSGRMCDAGCHGIVRKPVSAEGLVRALARTLKSPVPYAIGGNYLGPDRRARGEDRGRDPERRRVPTRGGWTKTPTLFYRPGQARPSVQRPAAARSADSAASPLSSGAMATATGASSAELPLPVATTSTTPAAAARGSAAFVETAAAAQDAERRATRPVETAERSPPRSAVRQAEPASQKRAQSSATDTERTGQIPARPASGAIDPTAPSTEQREATEFNLDTAVQQHRSWIASNGLSGARANLAGLSLEGAVLEGQNLAKANLRGANLAHADLRNSVLVDADLRNACLAQALLDEAQLAGAKIRHADLQFAQLSAAGLQGSDLAGADLRGAVLAGADLAGANLLGADIRGADLTVVNLTQKQLDRASGDATTRLPPGLFAPRADT